MSPEFESPSWCTAWRVIGCLLLVALLALALLPLPAVVTGEILTDKVWHTLAFMLLMLWFAGLYPRRRYLVLFLLLLGYGVVMEFAQSLVPNRYAEVADLLADMLGLLLGWGLALTRLHRWPLWLEQRFGA